MPRPRTAATTTGLHVTYCLAMRLDDGLVVMSDTRTNAGVDNISTYRKLHVFRPAADRIFVLQSAGNLATTQEVLDRLAHDLRAPGGAESLATVNEMYEAALYVGRVSRTVVNEHRDGLMSSGADGTATFLLSGQITGGRPDIMLIYPEGNYIRASDDRPFLQIGESKYGKFMLDIGVRSHANLAVAAKLALASMMSTARANLSVGPPYDLAVAEQCVRRQGESEPQHHRGKAVYGGSGRSGDRSEPQVNMTIPKALGFGSVRNRPICR